MPFIRNLWYVVGWSHELGPKPLARMVIGEPLVFYRNGAGQALAAEDRCPHRLAPLSLGRVEGDDLRCMYHGLKFRPDGRCIELPGAAKPPGNLQIRTYPCVEKHSWIWVWMGDPALADPSEIPAAVGLDDPDWAMQSGALDYDAHYELINDNLCDLSHLDFTHETTLGAATGAKWSNDAPKVVPLENGMLIERWLLGVSLSPQSEQRVDIWATYHYLLPGLFLMSSAAYPAGTAETSNYGEPDQSLPTFFKRAEQQSVTPIDERRTRYAFASGVPKEGATPEFLEGLFNVVNAAFAEDKRMIEGQQKIWNVTPDDRKMAFIPQDKAPAFMRRLIARRLAAESGAGPDAAQDAAE